MCTCMYVLVLSDWVRLLRSRCMIDDGEFWPLLEESKDLFIEKRHEKACLGVFHHGALFQPASRCRSKC